MRLRPHVIALSLTLWPMLAVAAQPGWVRFEIPESGASVNIPTSIFSEEGGKPETGYGALHDAGPARRFNGSVDHQH